MSCSECWKHIYGKCEKCGKVFEVNFDHFKNELKKCKGCDGYHMPKTGCK